MSEIKLNEVAVKIAVKIIKLSEGCYLRAYADPASDLARAIQGHNQWNAYLRGKWAVPKEWDHLKATPWSIGYGETQGITKNTVWTQQEADTKLDKRVREFMTEAIKATPALATFSAEKIAAITSLVYNVGVTNYKKYDISKRVQAKDHLEVYNKFKQYIIANGKPNDGLKARRNREADLYASVKE